MSEHKKSGLALPTLIGPQAKIVEAGFTPGLVRKPHIDVLLSSAYIVIDKELAALRDKVLRGDPLSESESRKLNNLTASLVKLAGEEREQQKQDRLDELDDKTLLEKAQSAIDVLIKK